MPAMPNPFPDPCVQYGKRIVVSVIEQRARVEPYAPWISVPVDDADLSKGYRDVTYKELNRAANHAARWLLHNLPASSKPFQPVAYAGPKDLRYAVFALAAGKLSKKLILPSMFLTDENHAHILNETECEVYLGTEDVADAIKAVLPYAPRVQYIAAPNLDNLFQDTEPIEMEFGRSWDEAKDDPWLVFHSSGTTGPPKPLTHTFCMVANLEIPAALDGVAESHIHQYANKRWYTHMRSLHYIGMVMILIFPPFVNMTTIISPPDTPVEAVPDILHLARADGILSTPISTREIMSFPAGLRSLQNLEFVHYAGGPLERRLGEQLTPYTKLAPLIGCTESGHHFTEIRPDDKEDWDYFSFQPHAGVKFEHRADAMYEMVIVRQAECAVQPIFIVFPDINKFETGDLWIPHPNRAGLWKPVGRTGDFVTLSDGKQYFVPQFEREIEQHPAIRFALIGGDGCPAPVLLLELSEEGENLNLDSSQHLLLETLQPLITRIREKNTLKLVPELTIFAAKNKPFLQTIKFNVARVPTLKLYEDEIQSLFARSTMQSQR